MKTDQNYRTRITEQDRKHEFFNGDLSTVTLKIKVKYDVAGKTKDNDYKFKFRNKDGILELVSTRERHIMDDYTGRVRFGSKSMIALDTAVKAIQKSNIELEVLHPFQEIQNIDYKAEDLEEGEK